MWEWGWDQRGADSLATHTVPVGIAVWPALCGRLDFTICDSTHPLFCQANRTSSEVELRAVRDAPDRRGHRFVLPARFVHVGCVHFRAIESPHQAVIDACFRPMIFGGLNLWRYRSRRHCYVRCGGHGSTPPFSVVAMSRMQRQARCENVRRDIFFPTCWYTYGIFMKDSIRGKTSIFFR